MTKFTLASQDDAKHHIAALFVNDSNFLKCHIGVREEHVFGNKQLSIGEISLQTTKSATKISSGMVEPLISNGAFEWKVPTVEKITNDLHMVLKQLEEEKEDTARQVLQNLITITTRSGILHPTFDSQDIEQMPLLGSTTVVADTSGILSGALDFIVRFFPAVRIKVPAFVHMEIVNMRDRFQTIRNKTDPSQELNTKGKRKEQKTLLLSRLNGEGGARVLFRLELQAPTEVERTYLLGDPLRNAFEPDRENSVQGLDIRKPHRVYADRLILESARHHQAQSGPKHTVRLLTGDKLLASMAISEGVPPMFIRKINERDFFGHLFTGQTFDPFTGRLRRVSLLALLWELVFAFGEVQLRSESNRCMILRATSLQYPWSTYHVAKDLLWCALPSLGPLTTSHDSNIQSRSHDNSNSVKKPTATRSSIGGELGKIVFQRFSVGNLFSLIIELDIAHELSQSKIGELLGIKGARGLNEYKQFLSYGKLISLQDTVWRGTQKLKGLSAALRSERILEIRELLLLSPSFKRFKEIVDDCNLGSPIPTGSFGRALRTYTVLGEITHIVARVGQLGFFPTPTVPDVNSFSNVAVKRFAELDDGSGLVVAGEWLESLIRVNGIHPEIAKQCLSVASKRNLISRSTEGSTTQIRNDQHSIHVLRVKSGMPVVKKIFLYRGDYLVDGKGSVSLRIKRAAS